MSERGAFIFICAALVLPSTAEAGFFDQLFGGGPSHSFFGDQPAIQYRAAPRHIHHPRKIVEEKPAVQTPTDLMHDETLHYGDAVMTTSGIKIFTGERHYVHDMDDFTPLKDVRMKPKEKMALAEINAARTGQALETNSSDQNALDQKSKTAPDVVTGRSAAVVTPAAKEVMINDHDGKPIRYVGP
jgi:hypothetical protein